MLFVMLYPAIGGRIARHTFDSSFSISRSNLRPSGAIYKDQNRNKLNWYLIRKIYTSESHKNCASLLHEQTL